MDPQSVDLDRLSLNHESKMEVDLQEIGDQKYPLLVLDNLFRDPEYVREIALSLPSEPPQNSHPGVQSRLKTDLTAIHGIAWKYVAHEFGYSVEQSISRSLFPGFAFMRINRPPDQLTIHQSRPHADPVRVAGVIYLNPVEQCRGGTAFYRHRATGVEECVLPRNKNDVFEQTFMKRAQERGVFQSYQNYCQTMFRLPYMEFIRSILTTMPRVKNYPTDSDQDWELTHKIDMKFNRFICYPGFLIHSGYYQHDWFGVETNQQRLTQNVFIG